MDKADESTTETKLTSIMYCICLTCGEIYDSKPCVPEMKGKLSHSYCNDCLKEEA